MGNTDNKYWKGLEEFNQEAEFEKHRHNEFAEKLPVDEVLSENDFNLNSNRRDFLKYMGFGISAATLVACTKTPVKKAIPYVDKPIEIEPGEANYYATTCFATSEAVSVIVKTREGRPIKVDGNYDSPLTKGGSSAIVQASVLSLYDNGRLKGPVKGNSATPWGDIDREVMQKLSQSQNIRILSNTIVSPSTKNIIEEFRSKYPSTKHVTYDPVSSYGMLSANKESFGKYLIPDYRFDKAKMIVGLNADFLGTWIAPVEFSKKYSAGRKVDKLKDMSFHVQFESNLSLTGSNADLRVPFKPSQEGAVVIALHNAIAKQTGGSSLPDPKIELAGNSINMTAKELLKNKGKSIVVSGSNDKGVQLIVNKINSMLGNYDKTISFESASLQKQGNDEEMMQLVKDMNAGKVDALIIYGSNPVYNYFDSKSFAEGLKKVKLKVSLNDRLDETSAMADYVCPDHHYLEAWGDAQPKLGVFSLAQPTIVPIFSTRAAQESLLKWAGSDKKYYDYIRDYWKSKIFSQQGQFSNFNSLWKKALHDGAFAAKGVKTSFVPMAVDSAGSDSTMVADTTQVDQVISNVGGMPGVNGNDQQGGNVGSSFSADVSGHASRLIKEAGNGGDVQLFLYEKVGVGNGDHANNPWLQELPDPTTKVSWDNYVCVSPKFAAEKGLKDESLVKISAGDYGVELPVVVQPGIPYGTIAVAVGYGRFANKEDFKVGHQIGKNVYPFVNASNGSFNYTNTGVTFEVLSGSYPIARSQTHHHIEGRDLVMEAGLKQYVSNPKSVEKKSHQLISLYKDWNYGKGHHWAMAIDLSACTGCSACVVSCQAENNVPVVGKEEVRRRRDMYWIRIDRYFGIVKDGNVLTKESEINDISDLDELENVQVNFQPVMCQHCDNAPCSNVCPVAAIATGNGGINQQVYNRCVGTRYCANNCPYKVRRFNWFQYAENENFDYNMNSDLGKMVLNPDVTVRARGVMEKCSFCVQKVQEGKLKAKKEGRQLKDGDVKTACQRACPADAIIFGDINNPETEVHKLVHKNHRSYTMLTDVNTRPSVHYMTKIRNEKNKEV